jgi:hypothetical protein
MKLRDEGAFERVGRMAAARQACVVRHAHSNGKA